MKTQEFIDQFNKQDSDNAKNKYMKDNVIRRDYIPYEEKVSLCKNIVDITYYKTEEVDGVETTTLHINSPMNYMFYCLTLVRSYTNIEIDYNIITTEFNLLNNGVYLGEILLHIPEKEIKEFKMILDMTEGDVIQNEYEIHSFISGQIGRALDVIAPTINATAPKIIDAINGIDEKTINKLLNGLKKFKLSK